MTKVERKKRKKKDWLNVMEVLLVGRLIDTLLNGNLSISKRRIKI